MSIRLKNKDFNVQQIADSGQCFRIYNDGMNSWTVKAFNRLLRISHEDNDEYVFETSHEEFLQIWFDYFDLRRDYGKIKRTICKSGDSYLISAVNYGKGIRILQQDLWETLVSFVISQRNNIPRIRNIISELCKKCGNSFPSPSIVAGYTDMELKNFGLGYRARYLKNIAQAVTDGSFNLQKLKKMDCRGAVSCLKLLNGVGDKVANCVALFGLHKIDAFPIDVWIQRIIDTQYHGKFDIKRFEGYAGIVQQYMFFYEKNKPV